MEYKIENATEDDRKELLALYKTQIGREYCPWDDHYPSEETIDFDLKRNSAFVMRSKDGIIGAVSIDKDEQVEAIEYWDKNLAPGGELSRLAVRPDMQNRGLARELLRFGMDELKKRGFKSIHFLVNKYNIKALRSYSALDFNTVGEVYMYEQDYICFEKEL
ncbi:MAG: GNAT family N-acetyltransferase [Lachnospiraceae bacterium]|nr:GNAT family N-acetyltransferase [Lachnospiraceae bacterium]